MFEQIQKLLDDQLWEMKQEIRQRDVKLCENMHKIPKYQGSKVFKRI